jgi:integrase/recombinase XerD
MQRNNELIPAYSIPYSDISTYQAQTDYSFAIAHFIDSQDVKQSSKALYSRTLAQYFNWIKKKGFSNALITRKEVIQYKEELLAAGYSPLTVGSYLTVVRKFYAFAEANKYYYNVAKEIKTPKKSQSFEKETLTTDESGRLNIYMKTNASQRDYAILNLIQNTGLRTIEVVRANIEDITIRNGKRILLIQGKGRDAKDQLVILTDTAYKPIADYLEQRPKAKNNEPLFICESNNNKGRRLTTRFISGLIKQGLKNIGLNDRRYTAHSLRHTVGTLIYEKTGRIDEVQKALRHSNPATSQIYARKAIETASIMNNPLELLDGLFIN